MNDHERVQLLFGPYRAPPLRRGDRAFCQVRDYAVLVIGWSNAPIPWPKCIRLEPPRTGRGLLIDDELARAIRHESVVAVAHWWGVSLSTVGHWRTALEVTRTNNEGTHRLVLGAIGETLASRYGKRGRRGEARSVRGRVAVWTPEEVAQLGAVPDAEVARRTGRSLGAVNKKREALGRPALAGTPAGTLPKFWTAAEDEAVRTFPPEEVARRTGRTVHAVHHRRRALGVATGAQ
jgi:hypothetical protein